MLSLLHFKTICLHISGFSGTLKILIISFFFFFLFFSSNQRSSCCSGCQWPLDAQMVFKTASCCSKLPLSTGFLRVTTRLGLLGLHKHQCNVGSLRLIKGLCCCVLYHLLRSDCKCWKSSQKSNTVVQSRSYNTWTTISAACSVRRGMIFLMLCSANLHDCAVFVVWSL